MRSTPLWRAQRVTNSWLPLAIFSLVILIGSYLIINLLIAEMLTRFQQSVAELERDRQEAWRAEQKAKNRLRLRRVRVLISAMRAEKRRVAAEDGLEPRLGRLE